MEKVRNQMTKSFKSVQWNQPMADAWKLMQEGRIRHLPVIGAQGELAGILSDRDVKRAMDPSSLRFRAESVAADYMNWPVVTVEQNTPLVKAVKMMLDEKISALMVTRGSAVVGIITTEDMLRVLQEILLHEDKGGKLAVLDFSYEPLWREATRSAAAVGL
jgi:acetoin utilization protein AcuB